MNKIASLWSMPCQFILIFSHLIHLTGKDQRNINQASHLASIHSILQSLQIYQNICGLAVLWIFSRAKLLQQKVRYSKNDVFYTCALRKNPSFGDNYHSFWLGRFWDLLLSGEDITLLGDWSLFPNGKFIMIFLKWLQLDSNLEPLSS